MLIIIGVGAGTARATTYVPVTFDALVAEADVIFVGDVVDVRPFVLRTAAGSVIKTRVTFRVADPIYGTTSLVEVFDFLGGEINGVGMVVAGMPTFAVGDHRVVFARRGRSINAIVGFRQGLLDVERDANGVERVRSLDGTPVSGPDAFGASNRRTGVTRAPAMRLIDFRARIAEQLAAVHKR
jgi:hypothetical protein